MLRRPRRELKSDAPDLRIEFDRLDRPLDWRELFGVDGPVEIEVGIGKGRFLLAAAQARPEVLHLGIEWANKYLRIAESRARKRGLDNVRFVRVDARELVQRLIPTASVSTYYLFYPDPWPKKRHHKRRFVRPDTVGHVARTLLPDGRLHVATDHADYWKAIEEVLHDHPAFERLAAFGGDNFPLPVDQPLTNFEAKYGVEGRQRHRASWRRLETDAWSAPEPDPPGP